MRRLCAEPGCPDEPLRGGRCPRHSTFRQPAGHRDHSRLYSTKRWAMTRRRVLHDQPLCPCGAVATDVHHVRALADGGPQLERANLRALCRACHSRITRAELSGMGEGGAS